VILAAGQRLEHRLVGPSPDAAPTLVFLHEGLGSVSAWRDFPDRVAAATGLGALVYSRRGYGGSDPAPLPRPVGFMHDEAITVLPAVLDAAGVRRALLVGHSDGASIALIHAARFPGPRVVAAVLIAPHVFVEDLTVASIAAAADAYRAGPLRARLERHHGDNVDGAFWGWNQVWLSPEFRSWDITAEVEKIQAPLLVVQGEDDPYGTLAQVEAIQALACFHVETLVLPHCGHAPHRDQPEATLAAIAAFARRHP
jgi:pimeloyl-ACP methyl ester carboxylesterase